MSLNYIDYMPTELLWQVFEFLDLGTRWTAAKVCTRWSAILWHFGQPDDFERTALTPVDLVEKGRSHNLLRSVQIRDMNFQKAADIQLLMGYLFCEMQVENLLRLDIRISKEIWSDTFGKESDLHLPNLKYIRVQYRPAYEEQLVVMRCRIVAPKLRTFHQEGDTIRDLLLAFSDQIDTLMVMNCDKIDLFSMLGLAFPKLRSLILEVHNESPLQEAEWSFELKALFENLEHLKIIDWSGVLLPAFRFIVQYATKLKSLKIHTMEITVATLNQINSLEQLQELTIMAYMARNQQEGLSLPNLTKLTMFPGELIQLKSVPNLKALVLEYDPNLYGKGDAFIFLYDFLPGIAHLETLEFINMLVHSECIDNICASLPNLTTLKCINAEMEYYGPLTLLQKLKKLKLVRLENCRLAENVFSCEFKAGCLCKFCYDEDDWDDDEERLSRARRQNFFADLSSKYEDCAIAVSGGSLMWRFKSNHLALDVASKRAL